MPIKTCDTYIEQGLLLTGAVRKTHKRVVELAKKPGLTWHAFTIAVNVVNNDKDGRIDEDTMGAFLKLSGYELWGEIRPSARALKAISVSEKSERDRLESDKIYGEGTRGNVSEEGYIINFGKERNG